MANPTTWSGRTRIGCFLVVLLKANPLPGYPYSRQLASGELFFLELSSVPQKNGTISQSHRFHDSNQSIVYSLLCDSGGYRPVANIAGNQAGYQLYRYITGSTGQHVKDIFCVVLGLVFFFSLVAWLVGQPKTGHQPACSAARNQPKFLRSAPSKCC